MWHIRDGHFGHVDLAGLNVVSLGEFHSDANHAGIETDLLIVSRTSTGREYRAWLRPEGDVDPSQGAPLGAVCIESGAILTNPTAIRTGVGRSRVYRS